MTRLAIAALEDKEAEDISIIDISEVSVLADYFLIASGSRPQPDPGTYGRCGRKAGAVPATAQRNKLKAMTPPTGYSWITAILSSTFSNVKTAFSTILKRIWRDGKNCTGRFQLIPDSWQKPGKLPVCGNDLRRFMDSLRFALISQSCSDNLTRMLWRGLELFLNALEKWNNP